MRIVVDWKLCLGSGMRVGIAPGLFQLDSQGNMSVLIQNLPEESRTAVESASACCPVEAISVTEDD